MDSGDVNAPHSMGTTIIGVTYDGGVVLGADSRTSTGMYVANRASDKITQLTDNVYVCRSGSAADSQIVSDYVRYFLHQHTIQLGQPSTVKVAANLVRLLSYNNKNMLQTGLIVGGWDKYEGGKIYGIPLGGTVLELPFTIGGSGSSYLYGFFDQAWKEGMTREEAEQLVVKAVSLAIARDGANGGVVRTVNINKDGVTRKFYPGDTLPLWQEEMEPQNSLLDALSAASPEPMVRLPISMLSGCDCLRSRFTICFRLCTLLSPPTHQLVVKAVSLAIARDGASGGSRFTICFRLCTLLSPPTHQLVVKAVSLAIARDGASGGVVRTVTVDVSQKGGQFSLHIAKHSTVVFKPIKA